MALVMQLLWPLCLISSWAFSDGSIQNPDSLIGRENYEVIGIAERKDTLSIISTAAFVYYPYGKTRSLPAFYKRMKGGKLSVFDAFLLHATPKSIEKYGVLEIESGVTGIWHLYSFADGRLNGIKTRSDFQVEALE